jgi:hypothetical protein
MKTCTSLLLSAKVWPLATAIWLVVGCASQDRSHETNRPGSGIAEYRQLASTAHKAVDAAMASLATISVQSNTCPPEVLSNFASAVRRLQVESIQVRARSQAMQARGDAYFRDWHSNLARVKDPEIRGLAEKHRPLLEQSFGRVKQSSQEGHDAFQPFIAALRQLRNELEKDPTSLSNDASQKSIQAAKENGTRVARCLESIERELDSMSSLITPPGKTPHQGQP